jgi:hypothetical protein
MRSLLPDHEDISEFEHPLTRKELETVTGRFEVRAQRYFRLPLVPLLSRVFPSIGAAAWRADGWMIRHLPAVEGFATVVTLKLQK